MRYYCKVDFMGTVVGEAKGANKKASKQSASLNALKFIAPKVYLELSQTFDVDKD